MKTLIKNLIVIALLLPIPLLMGLVNESKNTTSRQEISESQEKVRALEPRVIIEVFKENVLLNIPFEGAWEPLKKGKIYLYDSDVIWSDAGSVFNIKFLGVINPATGKIRTITFRGEHVLKISKDFLRDVDFTTIKYQDKRREQDLKAEDLVTPPALFTQAWQRFIYLGEQTIEQIAGGGKKKNPEPFLQFHQPHQRARIDTPLYPIKLRLKWGVSPDLVDKDITVSMQRAKGTDRVNYLKENISAYEFVGITRKNFYDVELSEPGMYFFGIEVQEYGKTIKDNTWIIATKDHVKRFTAKIPHTGVRLTFPANNMILYINPDHPNKFYEEFDLRRYHINFHWENLFPEVKFKDFLFQVFPKNANDKLVVDAKYVNSPSTISSLSPKAYRWKVSATLEDPIRLPNGVILDKIESETFNFEIKVNKQKNYQNLVKYFNEDTIKTKSKGLLYIEANP